MFFPNAKINRIFNFSSSKNQDQPRYLHVFFERQLEEHTFRFFLYHTPISSPSRTQKLPTGVKLLAVKKIPKMYNVPQKAWKAGYITYTASPYAPFRNTDGLCFHSVSYYPKKYLPFSTGIGYYLEAIAVHHLDRMFHQSSNFNLFVATSLLPSNSRMRQLERVGLPIGEPVDPKEWKLGLGKAVHHKKNKFLGRLLEEEDIERKQPRGLWRDFCSSLDALFQK